MTSSGVIMSDNISAPPASTGELSATPQQMAHLNNLLPRGFRFESFDKVQKGPHKAGKRKKPIPVTTLVFANPPRRLKSNLSQQLALKMKNSRRRMDSQSPDIQPARKRPIHPKTLDT